MRLQLADPADHPSVGLLPFGVDLEDWKLPHMRGVLGLHRHVVRLVELESPSGRVGYVVKELPDHLVQREYRLLRGLAEDRLPTASVVAAVTGRTGHRDGLLVTRHLDYALPYRSLLSGRGLQIAFLGERLLDSLVGLLVRLHLAGFFWGDCSLSNALFRRDAGALQAYIIDVETSERYAKLTDGQRQMDLQIATENLAGGLLDLQAGGRLVAEIDPWEIAANLEERYAGLWQELTVGEDITNDEIWRVEQRLERLHDLGFDVAEMEVLTDDDGHRIRVVPRVVESGYHQERLLALTGLWAGENQARRLLGDIRSFGAEQSALSGKNLSENIAAVRWLDQRFEPTVAAIPPEFVGRLQTAEIYHQILEHRWFLCEQANRDVSMAETLASYIDDVLAHVPDETIRLDATGEHFFDFGPSPSRSPASASPTSPLAD